MRDDISFVNRDTKQRIKVSEADIKLINAILNKPPTFTDKSISDFEKQMFRLRLEIEIIIRWLDVMDILK